jgi:zeaxanthin glucosyltransferase
MKFGFICPNVPGHLNPMTALARHLQTRDHDVVFLYSSAAAGLPFVSANGKDVISEHLPEFSKKQGKDAWQFAMRILVSQSENIVKSLPNLVQSNQIDALVIDCVNFYAELPAIQLGIPYIHVSAAMHYDYSGHTPLSRYGWPHESTAAARVLRH